MKLKARKDGERGRGFNQAASWSNDESEGQTGLGPQYRKGSRRFRASAVFGAKSNAKPASFILITPDFSRGDSITSCVTG